MAAIKKSALQQKKDDEEDAKKKKRGVKAGRVPAFNKGSKD